ncbi:MULTISPECIES: hypothetical protein [Planktothricoides]|uniref:Uncharacterized protein n=2 Tax=Planktothricoides raciborskii TaxID=132608 RepID=A0AAU8JJU9_9CYAN|nr:MULTISPECIES: hypothetical protein [Planktothricoides]MBD2545723.1 hypothetical protein [Planktothricoides raciborskii FACHB-1370]MBD2582705.1 hypothetical protein [Planktothricoides raciborskii FACHB-1261]
MGQETEFLNQVSVLLQRLSQKPGFWVWVGVKKPGLAALHPTDNCDIWKRNPVSGYCKP